MSDGHWDAVRGSHRITEGTPDPGPAAADTGPAEADRGVRRSADVIVGWRVWRLATVESFSARSSRTRPLILVSVYMNSRWQPGEVMQACCRADNVRHGIHAFTTADEALQYMSEGGKQTRYVFGQVSLWGRVVIHERGYRAESAYPRHLFVPYRYSGGRDFVGELRRSYGIEADWTS